MPIKYQMLGGQKGLTELTITVSRPNTTVTITNEKFNKTLVSNDSLTVVCELPNGTYQITARGEDGKTAQQEITISNKEQTDLRFKTQVKKLPLNTKFKTKHGWKFITESKSDYETKLLSEYIIEDYVPKNDNYGGEIRDYLKSKFTSKELSKFKEWTQEVTSCDTYENTCRKWNITGAFLIPPEATGIMSYENGGRGTYLIDYTGSERYQGGSFYEYGSYVDVSGKEHNEVLFGSQHSTNKTPYGIVVRCRLKPDAYVYQDKDSDYWVITE